MEGNKQNIYIVRFENFNDDQRRLCHHSYLIRTHSHTDRHAHKYTHLATRLDEPLWGQCGRGGGGGRTDKQSPSEPGKVCRVLNKSLRWGPACWSRSVTTAAGNQGAWHARRGGRVGESCGERAEKYEWDGWKSGEECEKCAPVERGDYWQVGLSWARLCQETHAALSLAQIDGEHKTARQESDLQQKPRHPQTEDNEREKKEDAVPEERLNTSCSGHRQERERESKR